MCLVVRSLLFQLSPFTDLTLILSQFLSVRPLVNSLPKLFQLTVWQTKSIFPGLLPYSLPGSLLSSPPIKFPSRPVEPEEVVFFRCKRNAPFEHKKSSVGFTEYDPRTLDYDQFLKLALLCLYKINFREFSQIPKGRIIIINTADADKKNPDDHCIHYDAEGTVYYGVNGLLDVCPLSAERAIKLSDDA